MIITVENPQNWDFPLRACPSCTEQPFFTKISFLRVFLHYDQYETFICIFYFWKTNVLKKISALSWFCKKAGLGIKIAIFSKTDIFEISKKQIIWHKTIELFMVNYQIWYDMEDWLKCFEILQLAHKFTDTL